MSVSREEFIKNQRECEKNGVPFFMPSDGVCYHCSGDIISYLIKKGDDGKEIVTGCPICCYSYCE